MSGYSVRRRPPSLWRQLTDPHTPAGLPARLLAGFLFGVALSLLLVVLAGLLLLGLWLASFGPVAAALTFFGVICLGCSVYFAVA